MQHLELKATVEPATDLGEFEAVVATWDEDREGDRIVRGAFAKSIEEWRSVGRLMPLHWSHDPAQIVGSVDPGWMRETDAGLEVAGRVDLDTEKGRETWRQVKANRIGFSFGYLAAKTRDLNGGGRELLELDIFEVSVTFQPMNNRTRVTGTKAVEEDWRKAKRYEAPDGRLMDYDELLALCRKSFQADHPIRVSSFDA